MKRVWIIGARESKLAIVQARIVRKKLQKKFPVERFLIRGYKSEGDKIVDRSLVEIGGKGLFIKVLEEKLLSGEIDLAVHSMKDIPAQMDPRFSLPIILRRDSHEDCFLSNGDISLSDLPPKSLIGTCSPRRQAQLRYHYNLQTENLRGNIGTRIEKIDQFAGIVLARTALQRLELTHLITENLHCIPAGGQGAIGVQCLTKSLKLREKIEKINHKKSAECIFLEREFLLYLQADCHVPVGILVQKKDNLFCVELEIFNRKNERQYLTWLGNFQRMRNWLSEKGREFRDYIR